MFNLETFTCNPTLEQFDQCRKADLILIAEFFDISVGRLKTKAEIKSDLYRQLVDRSVLPERPCSVTEGAGVATDEASIAATGEAEAPAVSQSIEPVNPPVFNPEITVRLKELEVELQRQNVRAIEIEAQKAIKLRELEIEAKRAEQPLPAPTTSTPRSTGESLDFRSDFDVSRQIRLVPHFRESEVDSYFEAFERVANSLSWPKSVWPLLLQCRLTGKALDVFSALPIEKSLEYDSVKTAVLQAYELVPEAYRQHFRAHLKTANQTFVEFAREKAALFDKWCKASKVTTFEQLRELVLLEDFRACVSEKLAVYLNEQKRSLLSDAAIAADEFVLTHKAVFPSAFRVDACRVDASRKLDLGPRRDRQISGSKMDSVSASSFKPGGSVKENRECFYCHKPGHLIADCQALQKKQGSLVPKGVGLIQSVSELHVASEVEFRQDKDVFEPFRLQGFISSCESMEIKQPVTILRDTGAAQSLLLSGVIPLSLDTYSGADRVVQGVGLSYVNVPIHSVYLKSDLVSGKVDVGICDTLPIPGVTFILGNDLAGGKVLPVPEVVTDPICSVQPPANQYETSENLPLTFPACVVTRAQSRKLKDVVDLSDSFLHPDRLNVSLSDSKSFGKVETVSDLSGVGNTVLDLGLCATREQLAIEQKSDSSLAQCRKAAEEVKADVSSSAYFWDGEILMRKWVPPKLSKTDSEWTTTYQIVVPTAYRSQVLTLAHDHCLSGHLGVTKTYKQILQHFFWPGLKSDVSAHCRSCHTCQLTGKPNQVIPPAPLQPIPVMCEPFETLLMDCVGPLPKTKSGHQYLLTLMCSATRFPQAIPLRTLKAKAIIKALINFCSTFGLPKYVQTDQGSNFMSKLFAQVLKQLSISHRVSSAYHPESQGALERFHQSLKAMLRKYCFESGREWDEGVPLVLFAVREAVQDSLGFSPAELVFGHTVRGPLKLLKDKWLFTDEPSTTNLLDYVSSFRERLHFACEAAKSMLASSQSKMKKHYDKCAVSRSFQPGDLVLVLLPLPGSSLQAKFSGPYVIDSKLSDTDYVVRTPDRRRKTRVCHINMLKGYVARENHDCKTSAPSSSSIPVASVSFVSTPLQPFETEEPMSSAPVVSARLQNSDILNNLPSFLSHLSDDCSQDISNLIESHKSLFSDHPSQTHVLEHDIDVNDHPPIKQHAYRLHPAKRTCMQKETQYLVDHGLAEPSSSPWSSPCILVPKPDGTLRFCTDYRKVNAVTRVDSFPLPRMEDCVDSVGSARYVSTLDLLKGYWQVPLTQRASDISAFVTPDDFLQYKVMAFGMRNAPATFQRLMSVVLKGIKNCKAYLDDLVIYSQSWSEHLTVLDLVFQRLEEAALTLNLAKCEFGKATVVYLGKEVGGGCVRPLGAKVEAIVNFPAPKTKRELRRFLGMVGYYRGFCRNFSTVVFPLTNLLRASVPFVWSVECQQAFDSVKSLLCCAPSACSSKFSMSF
uniref:Gypsy retrotransposon integrase-like protein 1 n=1 Tax=Astyanax mexicanus TaxID=7994 RepID=A0A3B1IMD5_ASTMX